MIRSAVQSAVSSAIRSMIGGSTFLPSSLFSAGEQGWVYDPSNLASLFQDAAGTTPVTAMEQPVGLQLDLKNGFPMLGDEKWGAFSRNNTSESGSTLPAACTSVASGLTGIYIPPLTVGKIYSVTISWSNNTSGKSVTVSSGASSVVFGSGATGTAQGYLITASAVNVYAFISATAGGQTFTVNSISVRELPGNHRFQTTSANRPVVSARVNLLTATEALATQTVTTRATTQTLTFTGSGSITLSGTATGTYTAGTYSVTTTAGSLTLTVSGTVTQADLRATNMGVGLPSYQRVNTSTDYDTAGFPIYIKPNGSNQFMVSNAIDFTATDKMTVWAGVRKLSDAAAGIFTELSVTAQTAGTFGLQAPNSSTNSYRFESGGSIAARNTDATSFPAPVTSVLTGSGNISGDVATIRVNGTQAATSSADQGTGNYGSYATYHYARAGTSLFFNGHDYGSICRGAASSAAQITAAEGWINQRTKAF